MEAVDMSRKLNALVSMGAGAIVENTLNKLLRYQLDKYRNAVRQVRGELTGFEKKYKKASEQFYREFEEGKLGDDGDYFEWGGLYENVLLFENRIKEIETLVS